MKFFFVGLIVLSLLANSIHAQSRKSAKNTDLSFRGARAEVYKTIGDVELKMHIFDPPASFEGPRPAIVFFFGGGWRAGSPKQFEQQCRYLATRGMVAMTADYRTRNAYGTDAKECVQDAKSALRWVRSNAKRLNVDPDRIVAGGGSAGGHLAACVATVMGFDEPGEDTTVSSEPNACVLFNPAVMIADSDGVTPIPADRAGDLKERMGTEPANLCPTHHIRPDLPPMIMFFGTEDFLLTGAKHFHQKMRAANNRCDLKLYEGYQHGFFNFGKSGNEPFKKTLIAADRFLAELGYVSGGPHVDEWLSSRDTSQ